MTRVPTASSTTAMTILVTRSSSQPEPQAQLQEALDEPPTDGGLWTGPKAAHWIQILTGHRVPAQRGWEYLKHLNYSKRLLRSRHAKADPEAQEAFRKNSRSR